MINKEEIAQQERLLEIHRRTIAHYLKQRALLGVAFAPPAIAHGIHEACEEISHIKTFLISQGVSVTDHVNDTPPSEVLSPGELQYIIRAVYENMRWLNNTFLIFYIFAIVIIILKINGVESPLVNALTANSYLVVLTFSVVHFYVTWLLISSIYTLWRTKSFDICLQTFREITVTGNILVRGLIPRTETLGRTRTFTFYRMRHEDPSAWVALLSAIIIIATVVPFHIGNFIVFIVLVALSGILLVINWVIGSNWIVALSELSIPQDKSLYLSSVSGFGNGLVTSAMIPEVLMLIAGRILGKIGRTSTTTLTTFPWPRQLIKVSFLSQMILIRVGKKVRKTQESQEATKYSMIGMIYGHEFSKGVCRKCGCSQIYVEHSRLYCKVKDK
jgi:hypothetical protein